MGSLDGKFAKKWLLYAASCALLVAIPVTGSRTAVIVMLPLLVCVAVAAMSGISQLASTLKAIVAMTAVVVVVSQLPVALESMQTFEERFSNASASEGDIRAQSHYAS